MSLFSVEFILFVIVAVGIYMICPKKYSHIWLAVISAVFYISAGVSGGLIAVAIVVITYVCGILLGKKHSKILLIAAVVATLSPLIYLKYGNFILKTLGDESHKISFIVPLGLSFFSLQAVSYLVDIYNGKIKPERNFICYFQFLLCFAYVTSGPIERADRILPQLKEKRCTYEKVCLGSQLFLWGLFQKLVVAERLQIVANTVFDNYTYYSGYEMFLGTVAYSLQIYFDFAGYSNMAMGLAQMIGIKIIQNFEQPYFSGSIAEFWRRWHISLSSWLRDYVYIPLGGNRKGKFRKYLNVIIVFLVSGIWHGANWTFILWGLLHGFYQVIGAFTKKTKKKICTVLKINQESKGYRIVQMGMNFLLINFAWVLFRASSVKQALEMYRRIFLGMNVANSFGIKKAAEWPWRSVIGLNLVTSEDRLYNLLGLDMDNIHILAVAVLIAIVVDIMHYKGIRIRELISKEDLWFRWVLYIGVFFVVITFGIYGSYDASSFIYANF